MKPENITAWALNQLSTEDAAQFEAELQQNAVEQSCAVETQEFCQFLSGELKDNSLALTEEQRKRLMKPRLEVIKSANISFKPKPLNWWQRPAFPLAAAAAVVALGIGTAVYLPTLNEPVSGLGALAQSSTADIRVKLPNKAQLLATTKAISPSPVAPFRAALQARPRDCNHGTACRRGIFPCLGHFRGAPASSRPSVPRRCRASRPPTACHGFKPV
jgi:hypothetical protein